MVDSGRSGHGKVVMIYYELCEQLWAGSPATEQINVGLESTELVSNDVNLVVGNEMNLSHSTDESMSSTPEDTSTRINSSGVGNSLINSDELQQKYIKEGECLTAL